MGVKFKDITHPEKIEMKNLDNNVLTVDASNLIYKFLTTMRQGDGTPLRDLNGNITSHLNGILFQTATLIEQNIKPIYVFDGTITSSPLPIFIALKIKYNASNPVATPTQYLALQ